LDNEAQRRAVLIKALSAHKMPRFFMESHMAGVLSVSKAPEPSPFDDPFRADLQAFIATFCGTADLSIQSASCTRQGTASFHEALVAHTSTATVVPPSAAVAVTVKTPEQTSFRGDHLTSGRLTWADAVVIFKMKRHKTPRTAARLATRYRITPKAVRDVWTYKTWTVATKPLWTCKELSQFNRRPPLPQHGLNWVKHSSDFKLWTPGVSQHSVSGT